MYPPGIEGDGEEFPDGHRFLSQLSRGDAGIARIILRKWGGSTVRERGIGRDGKERRGTARGGLAPERRGKEEETGHLLTQSLTVLSMPHVAIRPGARAEKEKEEQVFVCTLAFHRGPEGALREIRSRKGSDTGGSLPPPHFAVLVPRPQQRQNSPRGRKPRREAGFLCTQAGILPDVPGDQAAVFGGTQEGGGSMRTPAHALGVSLQPRRGGMRLGSEEYAWRHVCLGEASSALVPYLPSRPLHLNVAARAPAPRVQDVDAPIKAGGCEDSAWRKHGERREGHDSGRVAANRYGRGACDRQDRGVGRDPTFHRVPAQRGNLVGVVRERGGALARRHVPELNSAVGRAGGQDLKGKEGGEEEMEGRGKA